MKCQIEHYWSFEANRLLSVCWTNIKYHLDSKFAFFSLYLCMLQPHYNSGYLHISVSGKCRNLPQNLHVMTMNRYLNLFSYLITSQSNAKMSYLFPDFLLHHQHYWLVKDRSWSKIIKAGRNQDPGSSIDQAKSINFDQSWLTRNVDSEPLTLLLIFYGPIHYTLTYKDFPSD